MPVLSPVLITRSIEEQSKLMVLEHDLVSSTSSQAAPDQSRMPFLESLMIEKAKQQTSFHMPGHKGTTAPHPMLLEYLGGDPHPADLVEKIKIYLNDRELLSKHGENGYRFVHAHFDREKLAKNFLECIENQIKVT